jgi:hypothetical protein
MQDYFGGTVAQYSSQNGQYTWFCCSKTAAVALERMLPYLVVKRDQARLAIEYQTLVPSQGVGSSTGRYNLGRRRELANQIRQLKRPWLVQG